MRFAPALHTPVLALALLAATAGTSPACPGDGPEGSWRVALSSADAGTRAAMERRDFARLESAGDFASEVSREAVAPAAESCAPQVTPATFSMLIELDPESHEWKLRAVPAPFELAPVDDPGLERSFEGLVEEPLPGGGVMVDLRGRFMDHAVVRFDAEGRPVIGCVPTMDEARRWMRASASQPAPKQP